MPARISSSSTASIAPPVARASSIAYGPSAGLPIASDLAIVSGLTGRQTSWPAANAAATGEQPERLRAVHDRHLARDQAGVDELLEAARELRELRAGGDRPHDAVRQLPAELLDGLEGQRLGALGVVRAQVDVHERPRRPLARDLGAEPVDVVVGAAHGHDLRAVGAGREHLLLLEVVRDQHVGGQPGGRGVGRDRVREVARGGTRERVEAELPCTRERDGHDAVLERVRRVRGLVLDPQLADPEALSEPLGLHERRPARGQRRARRAFQREELGVAPERVRPGLDPALERRRVLVRRRVGHLQRAEAAFADEARLERIGGLALLALQGICRHVVLVLRPVGAAEVRSCPGAPPHLPGLFVGA